MIDVLFSHWLPLTRRNMRYDFTNMRYRISALNKIITTVQCIIVLDYNIYWRLKHIPGITAHMRDYFCVSLVCILKLHACIKWYNDNLHRLIVKKSRLPVSVCNDSVVSNASFDVLTRRNISSPNRDPEFRFISIKNLYTNIIMNMAIPANPYKYCFIISPCAMRRNTLCGFRGYIDKLSANLSTVCLFRFCERIPITQMIQDFLQNLIFICSRCLSLLYEKYGYLFCHQNSRW